MTFYHVRITSASNPSREEVRVDLSREELMERYVLPYRKGHALVISGTSIPSNDIQRIRISRSEQDSKQLGNVIKAERRSSSIISVGGPSIDWRVARRAEDVTDEFITAPPGSEADYSGEADPEPMQLAELRPASDSRVVFVVHGRNNGARDALFQFLRAIDLHPLEWNEAVRSTGKTSPYVGEILDVAFSRAHAVVVLFTPDDEARLRQEFRLPGDPPHETELSGQARPNVLFEAGMAMSRSEERTVLVEIGVLRPFSDVGGRHTIRFDGSTPRRQELAQRLETAGCPVNLSGTDWHSTGDFDAVVRSLLTRSPTDSTPVEESSELEQVQFLSEEAISILSEVAKDRNCVIQSVSTPTGKLFQTNGKQYGRSGDRRVDARNEKALDDLLSLGMISDNTGEGKFFGLTPKAYDFLDSIGNSTP